MRHATVHAFACMLFAAGSAVAGPLLPQPSRAPYAPGEVVVVTAPGASLSAAAGSARASSPALAATLARFGLTHAETLRRASDPATRRVEVLRLRSDLADFDPRAAAAALRGQPGILAAAPNVRFDLHVTPNDPYLPSQWHLSNSAAAVHAPAGWSREVGKASVLVAIIDTGVDLEHADLYPKIWTNPGEIAGNGIDDDANGYQDDVHGWDFGDNDNDPNPDPIFDPATGVDVGWHGTFVAGLAAAATNNGVGVAGVAWGCRILPLKVSDIFGNMMLGAIASAVDYAVARRVAVINMSFGTTDPSAAAVLQAMVNEAAAANVVVVASAGNTGTDTPTWPAACDSVVAVASTNASNLRSTWSNWGWYVDCCAPGEDVVSTLARSYVYDYYSFAYFQSYFGFDGVHAYMSNSGSSFAAPLVSGAVALLRSHVPSASAKDVTWVMGHVGDVKLYDNPIGPKLNLDQLIGASLAVEPPPVPGAGLAFSPPAPNPASRTTTLRFTLPRAGAVRLAILDAAGRTVRVLSSGAQSAGAHAIAWDLRDDAGRPVAAGLYFARLESSGATSARRLVVTP